MGEVSGTCSHPANASGKRARGSLPSLSAAHASVGQTVGREVPRLGQGRLGKTETAKATLPLSLQPAPTPPHSHPEFLPNPGIPRTKGDRMVALTKTKGGILRADSEVWTSASWAQQVLAME